MVKKKVDLAKCDIGQLVGLAGKGNLDAIKTLRGMSRDLPDIACIMAILAPSARTMRMEKMFGDKQLGAFLLFQEKVEAIERQAAGDNPSSLEKLLAERIAMCWIDVQDHEFRYAMLGDSILSEYEWRSRMLDRAHGRYLSAIKALAHIRKLPLTIAQLNVADRQINTVGSAALAPPQDD